MQPDESVILTLISRLTALQPLQSLLGMHSAYQARLILSIR
jgi:hypothetical protein